MRKVTTLMQILLIHGRKFPEEELQDWGFNGTPINDVEYIHMTYFSTFTIGFRTHKACELAREQTGWATFDDRVLEVSREHDLVRTKEGYFGDWEIQPMPGSDDVYEPKKTHRNDACLL
ncbi:MAG: hypothetical protein ABSD31_01220 [Candidatus Binataceae bacterium]